MAPNVPFLGPVKHGTVGRRVIYIKRALSRAGYLKPWLGRFFTPFAGRGFAAAVDAFQKAHGLESNAVYGERTHELLCRTTAKGGGWAFGPYEHAQMNLLLRLKTIAERIAAYWHWWDWEVAHNGLIHYNQVRPQPDLAAKRKPPALPTEADCSDTAGELNPWLAGMPPFDSIWGFTGNGNTDSLRRSIFGKPITFAQYNAYSHDHIVLAFYGPNWGATEHVVAVKKLDPATGSGVIYSNGSERAPEIWPTLNWDAGLHFLGLIAYPVI